MTLIEKDFISKITLLGLFRLLRFHKSGSGKKY